jgi:branched-chain amino acid transport system ATP-binding protein
VKKGSIYSIIGPNGAGKTTIFNCISGIYPPDSGKIFYKGEDITYFKPYQVAKKGIARTFQNIELFSHMSTMDNLMLGRHLHMKTGVWSAFIAGFKAAREEFTQREGRGDHDFLLCRSEKACRQPPLRTELVELGRALP